MIRKILFIMGSLENGGGERSLINLLQLMNYEKYDVDLLLFKERGMFLGQLPQQVNLVSECEEVHFLYDDTIKNAIDIRHPILSYVHIFGTLLSKIKSKSGFHKGQYRWEHFYKNAIPTLDRYYDVAVSFLEGENMLYLVDKVSAGKKIAWIHTDYSKINADQNMDLRYLKKIDHIITISDTCAEVLKTTFPDVDEKISVLPNLINSETIRFLAKEFYPIEYEECDLKIVSVGRLVPLKGFDMAIEAAAILKKRNMQFKWFVLGEGPERSRLMSLIKQYNVEDCFELLGVRENPYVYIGQADIVVQTSRYEGKSIVLDEAKILGKPIVVTNYDTVQDQINDNEGIIVTMNPESIANAIEIMIANKEKYSMYLQENEYGNQNKIEAYYKLFG